jgi:hypothetical protein
VAEHSHQRYLADQELMFEDLACEKTSVAGNASPHVHVSATEMLSTPMNRPYVGIDRALIVQRIGDIGHSSIV